MTASQVSGTARRTAGMASMRNRCPFSGSSRATTPSSGADGEMNSPRSAHGRTGPLKRERSIPFGTTANAGAVPALRADLALDRLRRDDQPVHRRGERRQQPHVLGGADA